MPAYGIPIAIAYLIVVGATPVGELYVGFRVLNGLIAAVVLTVYLWRAPSSADEVDKMVVGAVVVFAWLSVVSAFPRQSLDAVLSMSAYAAGLFVARDVFRDARTRRLVKGTMRVLFLIVVALAVVQQLQPIMDWVQVVGWSPPPPTGMPFSGLQWGNRYDLVLLALLLFPAWLTGGFARARLVSIGGMGLVLGLVVLNAGSRNVWFAVVGATLVILAQRILGRRRWLRPSVWIGVGAVVVVVGVALVAVEPLRDRLLTPQTIGQRYAMWSAIVQAWIERPLVGYGPGSFPWVLQLTDYFNTNAIGPRHPDSAVFQLLAEGGIAGLAAAGALVVGVGRRLMRHGSAVEIWPLAFFALAGLNSNPTDFGFLAVTAIIWTALALPHGGPSASGETVRQPHLKVAFMAGSTIVLCAYVLTFAAGVKYEAGFVAGGRGDLARARTDLETAALLDPGMALYWRQAGTAALLQGDADTAVEHLRRALLLNGVDDLSWRTLALAHEAQGQTVAASEAAERAVAIQRSDPTNLLLVLSLSARAGQPSAPDEVAEITLSWPSLTAAAGWSELLPRGMTETDAVELALARWQAGGSAAGQLAGEPFLLVLLGHRPDLVDQALAVGGISASFGDPARAMAACDPHAATALEAMPDPARQDATFWSLAAKLDGVGRIDGAGARRVLEAMTGRQLTASLRGNLLNPLHENNSGGYSADAWGYRRLPIAWPEPSIMLPSRVAGEAALLYGWNDIVCGRFAAPDG
ncbi:MAG: O-antigen ligase family protein [Chloroflexi bacterium]|nr:O-antigen ligase family protein [Chloroflexota bacterium]